MVDMSPLERQVTQEEISAALEHRREQGAGLSFWDVAMPLGVFAVLVVIFWNIVDMFALHAANDVGWSRRFLFPALMGITVLGLVGSVAAAPVRWWRRRRREGTLLAFARANNLAYRPSVSGRPPALHATVLKQGDRQRAIDLLHRQGDTIHPGKLWATGNYRWTVEGGEDSSDSNYDLWFATWRLPRRMPQVIIDYKDLARDSTAVATHGHQRSQQLSFGEPFDSHFRVLAPQGLQRDVFQLMPPHVLQRIMTDLPPGWDAEIVGDQFTVFTGRCQPVESPDLWRSLERLEQGLVQDLCRLSARMVDSRAREVQAFSYGGAVLKKRRFGAWTLRSAASFLVGMVLMYLFIFH